MSIVAGKPPEGEPMKSETNPPFKHEQPTAELSPPPRPEGHPMNDQQVLRMLHGEQ